jgi:hypothetical protein
MNQDATIQTFFPGHDDGDTHHRIAKDGTRRCGKCGDDMGAFDKVRIRGGPADRCAQCNNLVSDLKMVETPSGRYCSERCVVDHARKEIQTAMTPVGERPSKRSLTPARMEESMRLQVAKKIMEHAEKTGVDPMSFNLSEAVDAVEDAERKRMKQRMMESVWNARMSAASPPVNPNGAIPTDQEQLREQFRTLKEESVLRERKLMTQGYSTFASVSAEAKQKMAATVAERLASLTPEQIGQARSRAQEALEIALFHTDSAVQAHLLCDPKFDDPNEAALEMKRCWDADTGGWRTDATKRATRMIEIMDARGKRTLRGP